MAKTKASSKKQKQQQKRGVDFKKIKRKLGRKLPPPKNATNTEIKSKAIVLPEQSVASEKAGLAVSKKGLTLKELLSQTSHHNAKVRKDALLGMKDLFINHPEELTMHRYAVMEKLRERFNDDDRVVRDTLYQLLKAVILPGCKEDNQEPLIAVMMAYIFNAMTHLAPNVRLMAFKFLDLIVQYYPPSFFLYAEKILQNYEDILRRNQLLLEDKGKFKNTLSGLMRCLSLLSPNREQMETSEKDASKPNVLHAYEPYQLRELSNEFSVIAKKLNDILPVLVSCFQDSFSVIYGTLPLDAQSFDCILSILQSIDLAVQFFVHETRKGDPELELNGGHKMTLWYKNIAPLLYKKILGIFPLNAAHLVSDKDEDRYFILNIGITQIFLHLSDCMWPPADILEKYFSFIEGLLLGESCGNMGSGKSLREKYISTLVPFAPKLLTQVTGHLKSRLVEAFTYTFQNCNPESSTKLACLKAVGEILFTREDTLFLDASTPELLDHWAIWIRMLPELLILLGHRLPWVSKVVLHLLHSLGQRCVVNPILEQEYDNLQYSLQQFYCMCLDDGNIIYGPFISLPKDLQELSLCCVYYLSHVDSSLLRSIACCCLCHDLDQLTLIRTIEVLDSAYRAGRILISDQISFLITLICRFQVFPENIIPSVGIDIDFSNRGIFKRVAKEVCSRLSQMGDSSVVLRVVENVILEQMTPKPPLDNACAMLRILAKLDSRPSRLSNQIIIPLSDFLLGYLIDVVCCIPRDDKKPVDSARMRHFYNNPCYALFYKCPQLLNLMLSLMGAMVTNYDSNSSMIDAVVSVLLLMHEDVKIQPIMSSLDAWTEILEKLYSLLSSEQLSIEERNRMKDAFHRLESATSTFV